MPCIQLPVILLTLLGTITAHQSDAQPTGVSPARSLDSLLQNYAYRALVGPRTGVTYTAEVPANITGVKLSVVRLRTGSLVKRGFEHFNEFDAPAGLVQAPYVGRLALVYQNLGNWSSFYYDVPGYRFLTPVLGLLAYDATDLTAARFLELEIAATRKPISINFTNMSQVPSGVAASCVYFHANGSYRMGDLMPGNLCTSYSTGHFSIVVNRTEIGTAPSPAPSSGPAGPSSVPGEKGESKKWKVVGAVVGSFLALLLIFFLLFWVRRWRRGEKMADMVKRSEGGEVLKMQNVGNAHLPVASMVRTRPVLENDYAP